MEYIIFSVIAAASMGFLRLICVARSAYFMATSQRISRFHIRSFAAAGTEPRVKVAGPAADRGRIICMVFPV